ncbi:MAG: 2-succinylbenzoate-CoA ligase, partial [Chloroflexi bacterium]
MIPADWLAHRAISSPDRVALIYGGRQWRYAELNELVAAMAGRLQAAGVRAGDHVAVLMPNCPEYVCVIHALTRLGVVLVPLNLRLTPGELRWQIVAADCAFLLCSQDTQALAMAVAKHRPAMDHAELRVLPVDGLQPADHRFARPGASLTSADGRWEGRPPDWEAVQGIIFTSGTTGRPKGAMLTYGNHLASATASAFRLGTLPEDRWLVCMPLYHVGGLAIVLRCCLYGTTVVLQNRFDPDEVNQALDTQAVTLLSLVPTMLRRLLEARGSRPFPASLRCVLVGGAPASAALLQQSLALGVPVATTYGLTEAASQVATATPADVRRKAGADETGLGHFVGR